jgi:hypothetical protein
MAGDHSGESTLFMIRRFLLWIIALVLFGLETELVFLNHLNSPLQILPVGLVAGALSAVAWTVLWPAPAGVRILRGILYACSIAGALGMVIHWQMNLENQSRIRRGRRPGFEGEAPPLAPAAMLPLGLLGLACTYRHPALDEGFGERVQSIL